MTYIQNRNFGLEVSKGNIPKHTQLHIFGSNHDVDTGTAPEDVWPSGGLYVSPTAARIHAVVSSSAADAAAGTGARTIKVEGLDGSFNQISETVTMNGVTPVNTVNSYVFISKAYTLTAGSGGVNAGNITFTAATDATISAFMEIGYNTTQLGIYMVPVGYKYYISNIVANMQNSTANSNCDVHLMIKEFGGAFVVMDDFNVNNSGTNFARDSYDPPMMIPAKALIKMQVFGVSNNNTDVTINLCGYLVQD